jgi:hypothetical protein
LYKEIRSKKAKTCRKRANHVLPHSLLAMASNFTGETSNNSLWRFGGKQDPQFCCLARLASYLLDVASYDSPALVKIVFLAQKPQNQVFLSIFEHI